MTYYLGIDPGKQGALCVLDDDGMTVQAHDMPDTTAALHDLVAGLPMIKAALLEKPFFPRMIGINNAVKIAQAYGTLTGALAWRSIPVREITPSDWKAKLGLSSVKAASREKATMYFPDNADQWKRAKDDGRAEAALLAWLAREKFK